MSREGQDHRSLGEGSADREPWEVIARSTELAEIGYWADCLEGEEVETLVQPASDFHALDGSWHSSFSLCVWKSKAALARQRLREWAEQEQGDSEERTGTGPWDVLASYRPSSLLEDPDAQADQGPSPRLMRAFVFAVLAGSIGYYAGAGSLVGPKRPAAAPAKPSLWNAIQEANEPFATPGGPGQPRTRLRFDARSNAILLEVERQPGGTFEVQERFPAR